MAYLKSCSHLARTFVILVPVFSVVLFTTNSAHAQTAVPWGTKCDNDWGGAGTVLAFPPSDNNFRPVERRRNVREIMRDRAERRRTLEALGGGTSGSQANRAKRIRENRGRIKFYGIGHASILSAMEAFEDINDENLTSNVQTKGKIFAFYNNKNELDTKKSCMAVEMQLIYTKRNGRTKTIRYRLHIFFKPKQVIERRYPGSPGYDANNVFPEFPDLKISDAIAGDRKWKIYDTGKSIQISYAELKRSRSPFQRWRTIRQTEPVGKRLYRGDDSNCIDMMFEPEPGTHLGRLSPPAYCLGRCKSPPVINTGL